MNDKKINCNKCETPEVVVPQCTNYCEYRTPSTCIDIDTSEIECIEEDSITLQELAEKVLCQEEPQTCNLETSIVNDSSNNYRVTVSGGEAPYTYTYSVNGGDIEGSSDDDIYTTDGGLQGLIKVVVEDNNGCKATEYFFAEFID